MKIHFCLELKFKFKNAKHSYSYTYLDCLHELNYAFYYSMYNVKRKFKFIPNFYNN